MPILAAVGSSQTFSSASGGKVKGFNAIGASPINVAPSNPNRVQVIFHNPGTAATIFVAPLLDRDGLAITPTLTSLGGCFAVFPGGFLAIQGECQGQWQALASVGVNNPLTVMDSNV
jgi:hypothetical protein